MTNLAGEAVDRSDELEQRVWQLAERLRDSRLDITGMRTTYSTLLHELEKHQLYVEADNRIHADRQPLEETMTAEELDVLARLRKTFPSDEDRSWQRAYGSIRPISDRGGEPRYSQF